MDWRLFLFGFSVRAFTVKLDISGIDKDRSRKWTTGDETEPL